MSNDTKVLNRADNVAGSRGELPTDVYTVRVIKVDAKVNEKWGCDQTNVQLEIVSPEQVEVNGRTEMVAGRKLNTCFMHTPAEEWGQAQVVLFGDTIGLDSAVVDDVVQFRDWLNTKPTLLWLLSSEESVKVWPKTYKGVDADGKPLAGKPVMTAAGVKITNGYQIRANLRDVIGLES